MQPSSHLWFCIFVVRKVCCKKFIFQFHEPIARKLMFVLLLSKILYIKLLIFFVDKLKNIYDPKQHLDYIGCIKNIAARFEVQGLIAGCTYLCSCRATKIGLIVKKQMWINSNAKQEAKTIANLNTFIYFCPLVAWKNQKMIFEIPHSHDDSNSI